MPSWVWPAHQSWSTTSSCLSNTIAFVQCAKRFFCHSYAISSLRARGKIETTSPILWTTLELLQATRGQDPGINPAMQATKLFRHHAICDRCDQVRLLQPDEPQYWHFTSSASAISAYNAQTTMCARRASGLMVALKETAQEQERNPHRIDLRPCTKDTIHVAFTVKPPNGTYNQHCARLGVFHKP